MIRQRMCAPRVAAAMVALLVLAWTSYLARAQVLEQVPADALVVVKVNNLRQVSDKVANLAQQWGIAGFNPEWADPLGSLKMHMGVEAGLAEERELAFVMLKPPVEGDDPQLLMLVPVQDYKAFVGNFAGATTEGNVTTVQFPGDAEPSYVSQWGDFAAISDEEDLVANKPAQQGVSVQGQVVRQQLEQRDIVALANMSAIRDIALPKLQGNREELLAEMEANLAGNEAAQPYAPALRTLTNQALDVAEGFLQQTESAALGIQLSAEGIGSTLVAEFRPDTYGARLVNQLKGTREPLVMDLPAAPYLFVGGATMEGDVVAKALEDFLAPVRAELQGTGEPGQAVEKYADAYLRQLRATDHMAYGMPQPSGVMGQGGIIQMVQVMSGNADQIIASFKDMYQTQQVLMSAIQATGPLQIKTNLVEDAKTVDGVTFDKLVTEFGGDADDPQVMQMQQMMQMMYGPEGSVAYIGQLEDDVLVVFGGDEALLTSAVQAAKANTRPLADAGHVAMVDQQLPGERIAVSYIMLDNILATVASYAGQFGVAVQLDFPPDLPPIGTTVSAEGAALRSDTFLPSQLVQSLIAAGMQAMMQMQGAQQPGGPGGL